MLGHKMWITSLCWEPYHKNSECQYLVSASKDCDLRIWDTIRSQTVRILSGHTKSVTCVKWGGNGLIYSASQDRTIKVWRAEDVSYNRKNILDKKQQIYIKLLKNSKYI